MEKCEDDNFKLWRERETEKNLSAIQFLLAKVTLLTRRSGGDWVTGTLQYVCESHPTVNPGFQKRHYELRVQPGGLVSEIN